MYREPTQREWLQRCQEGVCIIGVSRGVVEIVGPGDGLLLSLDHSQLDVFRSALDKAAIQAAEDRARRAHEVGEGTEPA